jgi:mRNA-degrading endonuclease YafQ of YafQ-DinJ toxin-antitoxin module
MWRLGRTDTFLRTARRFLQRRPQLRTPVSQVLAQIEKDPFASRLRTHALSGRLEGLHAVRVTHSVRLVVRIDVSAHEVVLLDLGSHDDVYR